MSVGERDPHTGHMTTGHQWNGIKELNTKVPKPVWIFLISSFLISVVMWLLLPAWPLVNTYTRGVLAIDERAQLKQELMIVDAQKTAAREKIMSSSYEDAKLDDGLIMYIRGAGRTLFLDNCAACHGTDGKGGPGYPNLTDNAWLWGSEDEPIEDSIMETLRVGINAQHEDTRVAEMLPFGRSQTLNRTEIGAIIDYVRSINAKPITESSETKVTESSTLFEENCASCHGEDGKGNGDLGAPDLTDSFWIYGGSRQALFKTLWNGRQGQMPSWEARLTEANRKLLTLYLLDLNSRQQSEP